MCRIFKRGDQQMETRGEAEPLPELDLCIMNPPFVRGKAGNESFNFLPSGEQEAVQARMRELGKQFDFVCDKGQGPGFVALACQRVKPGGRIAMILPSTLATGMGKAWGGSREKLERDFDLETLIVSRDSEHPNFSMSTNFQECVCVARKRCNGEKPEKKALFVALRRNPQSGGDGLAAARVIFEGGERGAGFGANWTRNSDNSRACRGTAKALGAAFRLPICIWRLSLSALRLTVRFPRWFPKAALRCVRCPNWRIWGVIAWTCI